MQRTVYMVLNDGETYSELAGCRIVSLPTSYNDEQVAAALADDLCEDRIILKSFSHEEQGELEGE